MINILGLFRFFRFGTKWNKGFGLKMTCPEISLHIISVTMQKKKQKRSSGAWGREQKGIALIESLVQHNFIPCFYYFSNYKTPRSVRFNKQIINILQ